MRRVLLCAASMCGASATAVAQNAMTLDTPMLGMTGWHTAPVVIDAPPLGMTGWGTEPVVIDTAALGMTGWRTDPVVIDTAVLGMTGWRTQLLGGTIDLRDPQGNACPRRAEAAISIRTNVPGPVAYELTCTGDRSWSQTATAHETGANTYIAVAVLPFSIARAEHVNCALKAETKVLALRGRDYGCTKRGGGDLVDTGPPPSDPPRVIVDPPRLVCVGGRVAATGRSPVHTCNCPDRHTLTRTGPNSFRCGKTVVSVTCTGGTAKGGHCVCAPSMRQIPAGANAWRCVPRGTPPGTSNPAGKTPANTRVPSKFQPGTINRFSQGGRDRKR